MVGKLFFDQIVGNQRQKDALMGGANGGGGVEDNLERGEGGRNEREARGVRLSDCQIELLSFMHLEAQHSSA